MKIRFKREKFINNECPAFTKHIVNVFYSKLLKNTRNHIPKLKKIETIVVRVHELYCGSEQFYFYVTINSHPEFMIRVNSYERTEYVGDKFYRYDWIHYFEGILDVDMGKNNSYQRYKERYLKKEKKSHTRRIMKRLVGELKEFKRLQDKFVLYDK